MPDSPQADEIEREFHRLIPITRALGVRVELVEPGRMVITAPLELNHNHLGTAFGGSLAAVATLAGYGVLWVALRDPAVHVVVRRSSLEYRHPVTGVIRADCRLPDERVMGAFRRRFQQVGKARLQLAVAIDQQGCRCVDFTGEFVALRTIPNFSE